MWGKILKIFSIIILILLISFSIFLFVYKDQIKVMNAVLDEDRETISHYIDEKDFNPNEIFGGINLIAFYLSEYKENSNLDFINFLLDKKVDPNKSSFLGEDISILIMPLLTDRLDIFNLLLSNNIDINKKIRGKHSPLYLAIILNKCEFAKALHKKGAELGMEKKDLYPKVIYDLDLCLK